MNPVTEKVTIGCLLQGLEELASRSETAGGQSGPDLHFAESFCHDEALLQCARFRQKPALEHAQLPADSPAYIAYLAGHIAAGRLAEKSADPLHPKDAPLYSVFNRLHGDFAHKSLEWQTPSERIPLPSESAKPLSAADYTRIAAEIRQALGSYRTNPSVNALLEVLEQYASFVPSGAAPDAADVSLYDHSKTAACVGSCLSEYLLAHSVSDYKTELYENEQAFLARKAFLLLSLDLSGIQSFIYSVDYEHALKSLRMRSFFLEIFLEHCIDTLLEAAGLTRANLIYSGGGHCYLLLPNTEAVKAQIEKVCETVNRWLIEQFEASLHMAAAYVECSGHDLMNQPAERRPYANIFIRLSRKLSDKKMRRYSAEEIRLLNRPAVSALRECRICGKTATLSAEKDICEWCEAFSAVSHAVFSSGLYVISKTFLPGAKGFRLPGLSGDVYLHFSDENQALEWAKTGSLLRVYCKNEPSAAFPGANKVYVADYAWSSLMSDLLTESTGIKRYAVLRMDVDNLGLAFVRGFEKDSPDPAVRYRYCTLTRTAAFSRQLSLFFKYYMNRILTNRVSVVYSGGDDVFLVGAWEDVIRSAVAIADAFRRYAMGRLTLSAGIGLFREKYPIYKSARETERLEDKSKSLPAKNAVTVFSEREEHTYPWEVFTSKVLGEKLGLLRRFFDPQEPVAGTAALHRLLSLLQSSDDRINVARYAYLLARMKPKGKPDKTYELFSREMFRWISDKNDRRQLITAIYIYLYSVRKRRCP